MDSAARSSRSSERLIRISLAALLLVVVGLFVAIVAGAVIFENYRRGVDLAMDVGRQQFDSLRTEIALQEQHLVQPVQAALGILVRDPLLGTGRAEDLASAFSAVLDANPQMTEVRVAYDDGTGFAVAHLTAANGLR